MNDFRKEYQYLKHGIMHASASVFSSGSYILDTRVTRFEKEYATYCQTTYCIGVGNGMEAIQIALLAAGIQAGDEIITTGLSAIETALAVSACGARPIFIDCDEYFHINANLLEQAITKKTKAIVPVHLYGQPADVKKITSIAKKHSLKVVYDACQAHGSSAYEKPIGSHGDATVFSFYPTKNLSAYGDGGAITTNNKTIYERCLLYRNAGRTKRYRHVVKGLNSRLDELQAAFLSKKLKHLDTFVRLRRERAAWYRKDLADIKQITLPHERTGTMHSYYLFVIQAPRRNRLQAFLKRKGIESAIHFPTPMPHQPCYQEYRNVRLPKTEQVVKNILSLPIHPFLTRGEVKKISETIRSFYMT